jgi:hypothetical protein
MLAWMQDRLVRADEWAGYVDRLPLSRAYLVADLARSCSSEWLAFAEAIEGRARAR